MFGIGHGPELIVILVVALLVFGPKKLPEMGRSIGKTVTEFRKGISEISKEKEEEPKTPPTTLNYSAIDNPTASTPTAETSASETSSNEVKVD
jgi:sec-independent protein translocase protein TatA